MKRKKSLLLAGVFTVLGLAILVWLGFWQLERLEGKRALLAKIDANMAAPPVALPETLIPEDWEYRRVCVAGEFLHGSELYLFSTSTAGEGGYHVYTPLVREDAVAVFINRGWVPNNRKNQASRAEGQAPGVQTVCGVFRTEGRKARFTPENDAAANIWYYRNSEQMARAAGLATPGPVFIDADATANPGGLPVGGQTKINIPNNHLGYAITWFGLALTLLGVFIAVVVSHKKKR